MNKTASVIHWIVFAMAFFLIFFLVFNGVSSGAGVRGAWPISYLWVVQDAESDLLFHEQNLKTAAESARLKMSTSSTDLGCGFYESKLPGEFQIPLLNTPDNFCSFDALEAEFLDSFKSNLAKDPLIEADYEVNILGNDLVGIAAEPSKKIQTDVYYPNWLGISMLKIYEYNPSFRINLGPGLSNFPKVREQAKQFVVSCQNQRDVESCITTNLPENWVSGSDCQKPINGEKRVVSFCVHGENELNYHFALDFSPSAPFSIEDISVKYNGYAYIINFPHDQSVDSYVLYFTDWPDAESQSGPSANLPSSSSLTAVGYVFESVPLISEENCPVGTEGRACLAQGRITYNLINTVIDPATTFFTITAINEGEESVIHHFAKASIVYYQ